MIFQTISYNGEELGVSFSHTPVIRGARDRYGVPLEPDEDEEIEIDTVVYKGVDVTAIVDLRMVESLLWDCVEQDYEEAA